MIYIKAPICGSNCTTCFCVCVTWCCYVFKQIYGNSSMQSRIVRTTTWIERRAAHGQVRCFSTLALWFSCLRKKRMLTSASRPSFKYLNKKSGFVVYFVTAFQKLATRLALRAESWSMDRSCSIEKNVVMNNTLRRRASDFHYLVEGEADVGSSPDGFDGSNVSLTWCWNYDYDDGY